MALESRCPLACSCAVGEATFRSNPSLHFMNLLLTKPSVFFGGGYVPLHPSLRLAHFFGIRCGHLPGIVMQGGYVPLNLRRRSCETGSMLNPSLWFANNGERTRPEHWFMINGERTRPGHWFKSNGEDIVHSTRAMQGGYLPLHLPHLLRRCAAPTDCRWTRHFLRNACLVAHRCTTPHFHLMSSLRRLLALLILLVPRARE